MVSIPTIMQTAKHHTLCYLGFLKIFVILFFFFGTKSFSLAQDKGQITTWHLEAMPQGITEPGRTYVAHWEVNYANAREGYVSAKLWPKGKPNCYSTASFKWTLSPGVNEIHQDDQIKVNLYIDAEKGPQCPAPTDPHIAVHPLKGLMYNQNVGGPCSKDGLDLIKHGDPATPRAGPYGLLKKATQGYLVVSDRYGAGGNVDATEGGFFILLHWRGCAYSIFYRFSAGKSTDTSPPAGNNPANIDLDADVYEAGESITIRYTNPGNNGNNIRIGIVPVGTSPNEMNAEATAVEDIGNHAEGVIRLNAPPYPGNYLVTQFNDQGIIITSAPFTVKPPEFGDEQITPADPIGHPALDCGPPVLASQHGWIDADLNSCIERGKNALTKAGLDIIKVENGYVFGEKGQKAAFVRCICTINGVQPVNESLMEVTVAVPRNSGAEAEPLRDFLTNYMINPNNSASPPVFTNSQENTIQNNYGVEENNTDDEISNKICRYPKGLRLMDEWLKKAKPLQDRGESLHYEPWGRIVGFSINSEITVSGPPSTPLSRCEWLWQRAETLNSQNLGTLKEYVYKKW